jgi:hypothetical protein
MPFSVTFLKTPPMQLTRHLDANATLVSLIEPLALRDGYSRPGCPVCRCCAPVVTSRVARTFMSRA